jgi:hypothetical protein
MELKSSLLHLQEPATCHYSEREREREEKNHTTENYNTNQTTA